MDYQAASDTELAKAVREGDSDAFSELNARYGWLVRQKARLFEGPSAPEREDLLQEGCVGLFAAAVSYSEDGKASFSTYAGTCVYNRMASAARKHGSMKNKALNESLPLDDAGAALVPGPEERLELHDQLVRLQARLEKELSPLERRALSLYLSGCGRGEIEKRSGLSIKAYDNALYRVREKLKAQGN